MNHITRTCSGPAAAEVVVRQMNDLIWKEEYDKVVHSKFTEVSGCVLRDDAWTEETLASWFDSLGCNRTAIEAVINHVHVANLFWLSEDESESPDVALVLTVGRKIKDAWEQYLSSSFPAKNMVVVFDETTPSDGWLGDLQVTAYTERKNQQ